MEIKDIEKILEEAIPLINESEGTIARAKLEDKLLLPVLHRSLYKQALVSAIWYQFIHTGSCQIRYKEIAQVIYFIYQQ